MTGIESQCPPWKLCRRKTIPLKYSAREKFQIPPPLNELKRHFVAHWLQKVSSIYTAKKLCKIILTKILNNTIQTFTGSKSAVKMLKQGVKYVQS